MPREKAQAAPTARPKVPMRQLGADCLVIALKRGNARGAKGAGHRHWLGSTGNGRNPMINGRRQPSIDGTSRMMREYQVRICERLGVKFPGPTRQTRKCSLRVYVFRFTPNSGSAAPGECPSSCDKCSAHGVLHSDKRLSRNPELAMLFR